VITLDILVARFPGLELGQLQEWIAEGMLRAEPGPSFTEIDVARIALSLLDQLYALRRELATLRCTPPPP